MEDKSAQLFQAIYENTPIGLVLVNEDKTLRSVNRYMFETFKLLPHSVEGLRFGNVFHCHAVGKDDLCGETEYCENCNLRNGITAVLDNGTVIPDSIMDHAFNINGVEQTKWFKISASQIKTEDDTFAVISFSDITTQKEYEALLNYQLTLDLATGVTNKYTLLNTLKNLCLGKGKLSIALLDFDDFKKINDTYGHVTGDRVLQIFCNTAMASVRRQDIFGRFGGEEFMLIFPGAAAGLLIKALERIAHATAEKCILELGFKPTFSVGVVELTSAQLRGMDVDAILIEVDENLYQAKSRGKNMIYTHGISVPFKK